MLDRDPEWGVYADRPNMTLDIRGSLKNTKISSNKYIVIEELISNSIDAFLIGRHQDPLVTDLRVACSP